MKKQIMTTMFAALIALPVAMPSAASAAPRHRHDYRWEGDRNNGWDPARHYHRGIIAAIIANGDWVGMTASIAAATAAIIAAAATARPAS